MEIWEPGMYRIQLRNMVQAVLRVPGNFTKNILEMAIVIDAGAGKENVKAVSKETARCLKSLGEAFCNVRLNTIIWTGDCEIEKNVDGLSRLMTDAWYDRYEEVQQSKELALLLEQLKKFYARSKLVIFFAGGGFSIDEQRAAKALHPFLGRKMIWVFTDKEKGRCVECLPGFYPGRFIIT